MTVNTDVKLEVFGISKSYGSFEALHDLSFEVGPGETLGLLGPNGAGKTTAIRVLTTIFSPTRGTFNLDGIPHTQHNKIRRRIGVLPESSGYPLRLTGLEYLVFFARLYGKSRETARKDAQRLLFVVGLSERAGSRISTYSRGMRQRLGIAKALVNDPEVLFLDEPTLGFDPKGQREVLDIIRGITRQLGSSVILSTHFLEAVEQVCSRVIILNRGRVIADGSVNEIKQLVRIPQTGRFQVPPKMHDTARILFKEFSLIGEVESHGAGSGSFKITLELEELDPLLTTNENLNIVLTALIEARIPVLSFSLESGSLSDAFLEMTKEEIR